MKRPQRESYPDYFETYIRLVPGDLVMKVLEDQILDLQFILSDVDEEKQGFRYAEGKWSLKEVIGHVIDTERIMIYRALCFARGHDAPQPGFDPDTFMKNVDFNKRSIYDLAHEFSVVRESAIILFKGMTDQELDRTGIASNWKMSVRSLAYTIAGHTIHHMNIIRSRYLI
ncbi:MAG: DinB family protein [Bacteroidia bacterium]|nr:DinB family protein [Bacteroidia bacterium]